MQRFYIADTHFGHSNVIKFDSRPFENVQEMEEKIVENWNAVVKKEDMVYILGDFCWSPNKKEWCRLLDELIGGKILIKGNHDLEQYSPEIKKRFQDIADYKEIADSGYHVIMSHYPMLCYKGSYNPNCVMLHGHVHTTRENDFCEKWKRELQSSRATMSDSCGNIFNVGCMMSSMNYTPKTLSEIIQSSKQSQG